MSLISLYIIISQFQMFLPLKDKRVLKNNLAKKIKQYDQSSPDLSVTTQKKSLVRRQTFGSLDPQIGNKPYNLIKSIDTQSWKQQTKMMKNSCSQTILHIQNRDLNINNTTIFDSQRSINQNLCRNGDGKKAKYKVISSKNQQVYCLKCAIKLLQKGIQIIQIPDDVPVKKGGNIKLLLQQLNNASRTLQNNWKALEKNYFFVQVDEQRGKISDAYDRIIQLIQLMKKEDIHKLQAIKSKILQESKQEVCSLKGTQKKIQILTQQLNESQNHQHEKLKKIIQNSKGIIQNTLNYQPLEFSLKREDIETIKQKILTRVSKEFYDREYPIHFSFNEKSQLLQTSEQSPHISLIHIRESDTYESNQSHQAAEKILNKIV